jgi:hypothetical protein
MKGAEEMRRVGDKVTRRLAGFQVTGLNDERGQVLAWTVILLPLLLALVGLVFDGGLLWVQFRQARWAADGAAVAAASEIDVAAFAREGQVVLHPEAPAVAGWYAQQNDPHLHITRVYVDDDNVVRVRGWVNVEPVFLSLFGVDGMKLNVRGQERPAWGISQEGQ